MLRVLARALRTTQHPHAAPAVTSANTSLRVLRVLRALGHGISLNPMGGQPTYALSAGSR